MTEARSEARRAELQLQPDGVWFRIVNGETVGDWQRGGTSAGCAVLAIMTRHGTAYAFNLWRGGAPVVLVDSNAVGCTGLRPRND